MTEAVSVVGLGKLGLCLAACLAHRGFRTIGVDVVPGIVDSVNSGRSPLVEPRMDDMIGLLGGGMLRATLDHGEAIRESDITFVLTATPSQPDGSFSNCHVESALESLARAFGESGKRFHTFVISSTVVPGSIEGSFIPLLERVSGRRLHEDFDVCFDPDFVALGNVVSDFLNPDLVIIGESRPGAGERIEDIHRRMCENTPHIARMSLVSAEVAKVSLNAYITVKISFANTLANICEKIPGADVDAVTSAIGRDRRISPHYFRGGLSFGGTCFPRDTRAFRAVAAKAGVEPHLINAVEQVNVHQDAHLAETVLRETERYKEPVVGILGLSFKPKTPVITEAPAIKLIRRLVERGVKIVVYDPLALEAAKAEFGGRIGYASTPAECLMASTVCVVTNQDKEYRQAVECFNPPCHLTVLDCWRCIDPAALAPDVDYVPLGKG